MVFDWLRNLAGSPPRRRGRLPRSERQRLTAMLDAEMAKKRRVRLPRACAQCGAILTNRGRRRWYCSQACWRRRRLVGTSRVAAEIRRATNAERAGSGIARVRRDRILDAIAQDHAADMAKQGYFAHKSPAGVTDTDRAEAFGFEHEWKGAGRVWIMDNIWRLDGSKTLPRNTARQAVNWWRSSPLHCANMLDERHERLGVGVAIGRRGAIYAVQAFS